MFYYLDQCISKFVKQHTITELQSTRHHIQIYVIEYQESDWDDLHFPYYIVNLQMYIPSNAHRGIRQLYCKCEIREHNNVDPCKRQLKVASHPSQSCLLTLKWQSLSTEVLPDQFNTIENLMMTICAPHLDSLIVYEHLVELEGEDPNIRGFGFKPC